MRDGWRQREKAQAQEAAAPGVYRFKVFDADGEEKASVWASVAEVPDGVTVALAYRYEDLSPAAGWQLEGRYGSLTIQSVAVVPDAPGLVLNCVPVEV
jgi:hypothetical protein